MGMRWEIRGAHGDVVWVLHMLVGATETKEDRQTEEYKRYKGGTRRTKRVAESGGLWAGWKMPGTLYSAPNSN